MGFVGAAEHPISGMLVVYEYLDGFNLEDYYHWQRNHKSLTVFKPKLKHSLKWAQQIFEALSALHSSCVPILHRDVKPSNLMLCKRIGQNGKQYFDVSPVCCRRVGLAATLHASHCDTTQEDFME